MSTETKTPREIADIMRYLTYSFDPGQPFVVSSGNEPNSHTHYRMPIVSETFTLDLEQIARRIHGNAQGKVGTWTKLNPLGENGIKKGNSDGGITDADMKERRVLTFDFDVHAEGGLATSHDEMTNGIIAMVTTANYLATEYGWPIPGRMV